MQLRPRHGRQHREDRTADATRLQRGSVTIACQQFPIIASASSIASPTSISYRPATCRWC